MDEDLQVHIGTLLVRRDTEINQARDSVVVRVLDIDHEDNRREPREGCPERVGRHCPWAIPYFEWDERTEG